MKTLLKVLIVGVLLVTLGCEKDDLIRSDIPESENTEIFTQDMAPQQVLDVIPEATVEYIKPENRASLAMRQVVCDDFLTPPFHAVTLLDGTSDIEYKEACVPSVPPRANLLWSFDLTGSMGEELANVVTNCEMIAEAIAGPGGPVQDCEVGLVSHMDYDGIYTSPVECGGGYSNTYGDASFGDYPYALNLDFTNDLDVMKAAVEGLSTASGVDMPENYARVFYESYADPNITWRGDAAKFMIAFLDNLPHDCDLGTGDDPGRDGDITTLGDNIDFDVAIAGMGAAGIKLIVIFSGDPSDFGFWSGLAGSNSHVTAYQINPDGTLPSTLPYMSIAEFIVSAIGNTGPQLVDIELEAEPGYESWVSFDPTIYTNVDPEDGPFPFEVTYTVPAGTPAGVYTFLIYMKVDGQIIDEQEVEITVFNKIFVPFDIKPTSCPNPMNRNAKGVLPVAIVGSPDFDVSMVDPGTVRLEGVAPLRWTWEDVTAPYYPLIGKRGMYACTEDGPDGIMDMTFKFKYQDIATLFPLASRGDVLVLTMTGMTYDGIPIEGEDVMVVRK